MTRAEARAEVLGILERDYKGAQELIGNSNGSIDRTRTFGFALVAALIGFTASSHILWPGLLAALACLLLAYLDGFHCWRYKQAVEHARRIERVNQLLYKAHTGTLSKREAKSLKVREASFLPGVLTGQGAYTTRDVRYSVPVPMLLLYGLLAIAGIGIGIYETTAGASTHTVNARILKAPEEHQVQPNLTVLIRNAMTPAERKHLARLIVQLHASQNPGAVQFAAAASGLLSGVPGAAATIITSLAHQATGLEQQAGEIISRALADAALTAASPGPQTTVNNSENDRSYFSLTGPSFVVNLAGSTSSEQKPAKNNNDTHTEHEQHTTPPGPPQHTETTRTSSVLPYTP
jgi:hypothetical protein